MQQVGLYVHRMRVFDEHIRLELGSDDGQFDLKVLVEGFLEHFSINGMNGDDRVSTLEIITREDEWVAGYIQYGSFGIAADIVDPTTD